jgi:TolA-binding protein
VSTSASGSGAAVPVTRLRTSTPTERHFQAGWALLRQGKAREAAVELAAAADAGDQDPLGVDARYFQAVALVRSDQSQQAERVLVAFLDRAPHSLRRGRASVLLAKLIASRGDLASARAWYGSAIDDPDPSIAAAARAGIAGLEPRGR